MPCCVSFHLCNVFGKFGGSSKNVKYPFLSKLFDNWGRISLGKKKYKSGNNNFFHIQAHIVFQVDMK